MGLYIKIEVGLTGYESRNQEKLIAAATNFPDLTWTVNLRETEGWLIYEGNLSYNDRVLEDALNENDTWARDLYKLLTQANEGKPFYMSCSIYNLEQPPMIEYKFDPENDDLEDIFPDYKEAEDDDENKDDAGLEINLETTINAILLEEATQ